MTIARLARLAFAMALVGLAGWSLVRSIDMRADMSFFLPRAATPDSQFLVDRLRDGPAANLVMVGIAGAAPADLVKVSDAFAADAMASGKFTFVLNGRFSLPEADLAAVLRHRYMLNPPFDPADFTADGLRAALRRLLATLGTSLGLALKDIFPADPTGRLTILANAWFGSAGPDRAQGVWLSRDGKEALFLVRTKAAAFDLNGQDEAVAALQASFAKTRAAPTMQLRMSGPSIFAVDIRTRIKHEMFVLSTISSVAVFVLLLLVFRSITHMLALGVPLLGGLIAGAAAVQLVFGHVHGLTLTFGSTLVGLAIDYPIYLAMHAASRASPRDAARQIQTPLLVSVLTAMAGFFPLTVSSFPGLSQLGLICMVGLFVAAILTRIVLPSLLTAQAPSRGQIALSRSVRILPTLHKLRIPSLVLVAAALIYFVVTPRSPWQDDLARLSPLPPAALEVDRQLRAEMQAADARSLIVVRGTTPDQVLERLENVTPDLDQAVAAKQIDSYDAPSRYLPSAATQQARKATLPTDDALRAALDAALKDMPFKPDTFAPFLRDVAAARTAAPVTLADFAGTQLALRIEALMFQADGGWIGMVLLNGTHDATPLAKTIKARAGKNVVFLDLKSESDALVASYRNEALRWLIAGVVLAIVVLAIGLRNWRDVVRVAGPITMSALLTGAILHLLGEPLSIFNLMALLIVEGVGMDYRVFFSRPFADDAERAQTFASIVLCASATFVVFAVLAFSALPVLHSIGLTVAIGTALSLLLTSVFAKPAAVPA